MALKDFILQEPSEGGFWNKITQSLSDYLNKNA
jgi:hypothetical protein